MKERYEFCNVKLDAISDEESFKMVESFVDTGDYHYQISVNAAKMVYAQKNIKLLKSINNADIINSDGMPIKIITDMISNKKTTRMGGLDYIEGLAELYPSFRYYFLGATKKVVEKVVEKYKTDYNLNIVGYRNGYFPDKKIKEIIKNINKTQPDILYIGMGSPTKEYILYEYRNQLECKFAVGVGGAFDIIAGKTERAPKWMQNAGLEWFYRILQEPGRMWKRYTYTNTIFMWLLIKGFYNHIINQNSGN